MREGGCKNTSILVILECVFGFFLGSQVERGGGAPGVLFYCEAEITFFVASRRSLCMYVDPRLQRGNTPTCSRLWIPAGAKYEHCCECGICYTPASTQ